MAKVTPGALAGQISGAVGTVVFARNRYGAYMRVRAKPIKPATGFQLEIKTALIRISKYWNNLTSADRLAWSAWANQNPVLDSLGYSHHLTGHAAFVKLNARRIRAYPTLALITSPPVLPNPSPLLSLSATGDIGAGASTLIYTPTPFTGAICPMIWATVLARDSIKFDSNLYKLVASATMDQSSPWDFQSAVESRFGALHVGQFLRFRVNVLNANTGLISSPMTCAVTVTTT
jgi:hypothetical protein